MIEQLQPADLLALAIFCFTGGAAFGALFTSWWWRREFAEISRRAGLAP
jgi:hypothetical protein